MLSIAYVIAPIFALILLGYALRRLGLPGDGFWELNDRLSYLVLMPALIFSKISTSTFGQQPLGAYGVTLLAGFGAAILVALAASALAGLRAPAATSVLQGSARHNSFLVMAVAAALLGPEGLAMAVLGIAMLVPVTNVVVVTLMTTQLQAGNGLGALRTLRAIARDLGRNPLILSVLAGILASLAGATAIPVLHEATALLGSAALPVLLLCVGANLRVRRMSADAVPVAAAFLGKILVFPLATFATARALGLPGDLVMVAMIFACVPTAAVSHALARQMGGDGPLMAAIITLQTFAAFLTMPLTLWLTARLVGS